MIKIQWLIVYIFIVLAQPIYAAEPEGVLALKTNPKGARVYINDELMLDSTPAVLRLPPGKHQLRVENRWLHQHSVVTIKARATVVKELELKPTIGATLVDLLKEGEPCPYCPEMVIIPTGKFMIGNPNGRGIEKPVQQERIENPFAMGKYEVTFAEYDAFAQATDKPLPDDNGWGRAKRPVVNVNWYQAVAYAKWLSEQTGQTYRLPTEVEWEYAARAETQTDYWWGIEIGQGNANCAVCGSQWDKHSTAPVGSFKPNPFGLYDMLGNVMEWTCSEYHFTYKGKQRRCGPSKPSIRYAIRGSAWNGDDMVRVTYRRGHKNSSQNTHLGFRLVRLNVLQLRP